MRIPSAAATIKLVGRAISPAVCLVYVLSIAYIFIVGKYEDMSDYLLICRKEKASKNHTTLRFPKLFSAVRRGIEPLFPP